MSSLRFSYGSSYETKFIMDEMERNACKVHNKESVQTVKRVENNFAQEGKIDEQERLF